jgi:hypothetical protein
MRCTLQSLKKQQSKLYFKRGTDKGCPIIVGEGHEFAATFRQGAAHIITFVDNVASNHSLCEEGIT